MTEDQAIKRLTGVMDQLLRDYPYGGDLEGRQIATLAWNEMKAIAREDEQGPLSAMYAKVCGMEHRAFLKKAAAR